MIEIGINPNTKNASVAIRLSGYFGINKDGIKLVDSDAVFPTDKIRLAGVLPSTAFDMLQKAQEKNVAKTTFNGYTDPNTGKFVAGNIGGGRPKGSKGKSKTPITDRIKYVLENKHYEKKDGTWVRADDLFAEAIVDQAVLRGNGKFTDLIMERVEGKVIQSLALSHGVMSDEERKRLTSLFPDEVPPQAPAEQAPQVEEPKQ